MYFPPLPFFPPCSLIHPFLSPLGVDSDMTKIDRAFSLPEGEHWDLVIHAYYDCIYEESMKVRRRDPRFLFFFFFFFDSLLTLIGSLSFSLFTSLSMS